MRYFLLSVCDPLRLLLLYVGDIFNGLQVHVRFWLCSNELQISCVCAVAVREGNAILGVDMCGSRSVTGVHVIRPKIKQYSLSDWGLPRGAFVSTDRGNQYYVSNWVYMLLFSTSIPVCSFYLIPYWFFIVILR